MCGISGILSVKLNSDQIYGSIQKMVSYQSHRGPDNDGKLKILENLYFGHNRLSILDLSSNGNQPMHSNNKNLTITYNGEIYNHKKIREKLDSIHKISWKSKCDTETLINSIEIIGLKKTLEMAEGMFAFAYFDKRKNKIFIARDRFGEKPLYYLNYHGTFSFSSEIGALTKVKIFNNEINEKSVFDFLNLSYIPSPNTIYKNIFKLEPGSILEVDVENFEKKKNFLKIEKWFDVNKNIEKLKSETIDDFEECSKYLEKEISRSIESQMISDVKIGSFLSGGIDSSLVSVLMQKNSTKKIDTFSAKFENPDYDESHYANQIANKIGTNHHELYISNKDIADNFEKMVEIFGEPFGDSSQIPTYILSRFTKKHVTVCLSGDGGDELFGGYNRYKYSNLVWKLYKIFNLKNNLNKKIFEKIPKNFFAYLLKIFKGNKISQIDDKISKIYSLFLNIKNENDIYYELISSIKPNNSIRCHENNNKFLDTREKMMILDIKNYLTDDILCKVDRCAMNNSLETRIPLLGKNVFNASWRIPPKFKFNKSETKYILKYILGKYIPKDLVYRKKMGFSIPLKDVLMNQLKDKLPDSIKKIKNQNYQFFDELPLNKTVNNKYKETINNNLYWNLLMLGEWLNKNK